MPISLFSALLGFVLGVVATAIAWNLTQRQVRNPETAKLTAQWSVKDVVPPGQGAAIVAERIEGVTLPAGSKILVPEEALGAVPAEILESCEVRSHPAARFHAVIGRDRALILSGRLHPQAYGFVTLEPATVRQLQGEFTRMWSEASVVIEPTRISEIASKVGRVVDVTGRASEVLEYRGRKMLRLTDGKDSIGIVTRQGDIAQHAGTTVRIVGRVARDQGYAYVEADRVMAVQTAPTMKA